MASSDHTLSSHLRELQDDIAATATQESISDTQLSMILNSETMDDSVKETFINMDSAIKTTAVSVRLNNLRHWNKLISVMLEMVGKIEKMEDKVNNAKWWKQPGAWLTGFAMFVMMILLMFSLFKIDGTAANGAAGFIQNMTKEAVDVTKTYMGNSGSSDAGNDRNYGNYNSNYNRGGGSNNSYNNYNRYDNYGNDPIGKAE